MSRVYCSKCKHFAVHAMYSWNDWLYCTACKDSLENYTDPKEKNKDNNCKDYEPKLWVKLFTRKVRK